MNQRHLFRPTVLGLRPSVLVFLYGWRLTSHKVQELLAGIGIAIGVALFFGVLVANTTITGSDSQVVHAVIGSAKLQLAARSSDGFDERIVGSVRRLPGVRVAVPVLREDAAIQGPNGRRLVQLVGVTPRLVALKSPVTRDLGAGAALLSGGVGLPSGIAQAIGAQGSQPVTLLANGDAHTVLVRAVLGSQTIGPVANSPIVIAQLSVAQRITEKTRRVTQILIEPRPGETRMVEGELLHLAAGRLDVEPADNELRLLSGASEPVSQSTALFAAISALVGLLLALNAMLLTVPERRRFAADLRTQGYTPRQIVLILVFQATTLGIAASMLGIAIGGVLSRSLAHQVPSYLTFAFPIGTYQIIQLKAVLLALGCGVLITLFASLPPLLVDLRARQPVDLVLLEAGESGQHIGKPVVLGLGIVGALLLAIVTIIISLAPSLTVFGGVVLAFATICFIPLTSLLFLRVLTPFSERIRGSMLALAVIELDSSATRSVALACVAALAVYGSVAIQGARRDLTHGLDSAITQYLDTADIWVTTGDNVFTTDSFRAGGAVAAIAQAPGVASVRIYQGSLLDIGRRRMWIRARPPTDSSMLQSSQMLQGNFTYATTLLRRGGWAAISNNFATEHRLKIGGPLTLPTPSGMAHLRVAAITTNTGWPAGAITLSTADYSRYWQTSDPAALEINLKPHITPIEGRRAVQRALGYRPGLWVQTRAAREAQFKSNARQALRSLGEISTLLLLAASLAIAFALSAAIWQRRNLLASLKTDGYNSKQLWRSLLLESAIVLGIGCLDGAVLGVYGHALATRWLKLTTGFPAPFTFGEAQILITLALVAGISLAVIALPGFSVARVSPNASFHE